MKNKVIITLVASVCLLLAGSIVSYYMEALPYFVPFGFFAVSLLLVALYCSLSTLQSINNLHLILIYKAIRLFTSLVMLLVGIKLHPEDKTWFVILFLAFYVVYLIYDSVFLFKMGNNNQVSV